MAVGLADFSSQTLLGMAGVVAAFGGAVMLSPTIQQHRAAQVAFFLAGAFFWLYGVVWAINATDQTMFARLLVSGIIGGAAAIGAVWIMSLASPAQEPVAASTQIAPVPSPSPSSVEQHNINAPNLNVPGVGNTIIINPTASPAPPSSTPSEQGKIYQAGIAVGDVFGGRRSVTDATTFEFIEITHAQQFNWGEIFTFEGVKLKFLSAQTRIGLDSKRPQDGMIYSNVIAKVIE